MSAQWFKSSFSGSEHTCVEVYIADDVALVRDSKYLLDPANDPTRQPSVEVSLSAWEAFLASAVDPTGPVAVGMPVIQRDSFGVSVSDGVSTLRYTHDEWLAFTAGIAVGEFQAA